jgi:hypothetical protein
LSFLKSFVGALNEILKLLHFQKPPNFLSIFKLFLTNFWLHDCWHNFNRKCDMLQNFPFPTTYSQPRWKCLWKKAFLKLFVFTDGTFLFVCRFNQHVVFSGWKKTHARQSVKNVRKLNTENHHMRWCVGKRQIKSLFMSDTYQLKKREDLINWKTEWQFFVS